MQRGTIFYPSEIKDELEAKPGINLKKMYACGYKDTKTIK